MDVLLVGLSFLMCWALLMFLAWEHESADPYSYVLLANWEGTSVNVAYRTEQVEHHEHIESTCAFCRTRTISRWCWQCAIYHCLSHHAARFAPCTQAWRASYARQIGSHYGVIRPPVALRVGHSAAARLE